MPRKRTLDLQVCYCSSRLQEKLNELPTARTAYIEAPSGYGKTTAVHMALKPTGDKACRVIGFTVLEGESLVRSWARFCRQLAVIDQKAGSRLQSLGLPDTDTIGDIAQALAEIDCPQTAYLVIDNLQYWLDSLPQDILRALAGHGGDQLHMVLISQPTAAGTILLADSGVLRINKADLSLSSCEIKEYYSMAGVTIDEADAETIEQNTEGWIAAVYLALLQYDGAPDAVVAHDIAALMRAAVWERLHESEQRLMLLLSPFSCFTRQQLVFMAGDQDDLAVPGGHLFSGKGFIRYDSRQGVYYPHTILLELLRSLFAEQGEEYRRGVWIRAGEWHEKTGNKISALDCYYKAREFEHFFALDVTGVELHTAGYPVEVIEEMLFSCPEEIILRHPMALLSFAYKLFSASKYEQFLRLCEEASALIPRTAFSGREKSRLLGELAMVKSFSYYNDIRKMSEQHRLAYQLIGGRSRVVNIRAPWTMGCPCVLYMFHSGTGWLSEEVACMEDCLPSYIQLAAGHGSGADTLMRAEALFFQGEKNQAEILALRAAYEAQTHRQASLLLCAWFLLARIALKKGDSSAFSMARKHMEQLVHGEAPSVRTAMEMASAHLLLIMNRPEDISDWLKEGVFQAKSLLAPAIPYAQMLHLYYCLQSRDYRRLFSLADLFLAQAARQNILVSQIYIELFLACAHYREGGTKAAQNAARRALALAMPDGIIAPFAELYADMPPLLHSMPLSEYAAQMDDLCEFAQSMAVGADELRGAFYPEKRPYTLTEREHEIAMLAAQRKTNIEIAEITRLSVATVRTHLRAIYEKTGIDSASKSKRNLLKTLLE